MKLLRVKVKPNARERRLERLNDGTWLAQVKAQPVKGRANEELITLIAHHFNLRRSQISIKSGMSGRIKIIQLEI